MNKKQTQWFQKLLLKERERLLQITRDIPAHELNIEREDLADELDLANTEVNQNLMFKLRNRERNLLAKIDAALGRIEDGTFGICDFCEEPIETKRLKARPVSTLCLRCKEEEERREKLYA